MGDRAIVSFPDSWTHGNAACNAPAVYVHNKGGDVLEWIKETRSLMGEWSRDMSYAAARFVQVAADNLPGSKSIGLTTIDTSDPADADPGDRGVYVVHAVDPGRGPAAVVFWIVRNFKCDHPVRGEPDRTLIVGPDFQAWSTTEERLEASIRTLETVPPDHFPATRRNA